MTTSTPGPVIKSLPARPPKELLASTTFLLHRLSLGLKERKMAALEPTGLNPLHYGVLALLEEGSRETQATIADALGYDRSYLVGALDELEERRLIERRRDPSDRRRHVVTLTPAGKEKLAELRAVIRRFEKESLIPLDAEQRETLHELLLLLAGHYDERFVPNERSRRR
jgi:DNA-binding MarR family transcriptional regulator